MILLDCQVIVNLLLLIGRLQCGYVRIGTDSTLIGAGTLFFFTDDALCEYGSHISRIHAVSSEQVAESVERCPGQDSSIDLPVDFASKNIQGRALVRFEPQLDRTWQSKISQIELVLSRIARTRTVWVGRPVLSGNRSFREVTVRGEAWKTSARRSGIRTAL